jgi:hypothetical protein
LEGVVNVSGVIDERAIRLYVRHADAIDALHLKRNLSREEFGHF